MAGGRAYKSSIWVHQQSLDITAQVITEIEISLFNIDILKKDVRGLLPQTHCQIVAKIVPGINQEQVLSCICPMFVNV